MPTSNGCRICLGSAQFGQSYGITNTQGKVSVDEVQRILDTAHNSGIQYIDTAQGYGNAEEILGRSFRSFHSFKLISKISAQNQIGFERKDVKYWENSLQLSLKRLKHGQLDSLLLHSPQDLQKSGNQYLQEWLLGVRDRGLVRRIGLSIYTKQDLFEVDYSIFNIIQLPLSLYDQRMLLDGTIESLSSNKVAIHVRSLFLQGLLLSHSTKWPRWIKPASINHHKRLEELAVHRGYNLIDLVMGFAKFCPNVEAFVMGVCDSNELDQNLRAWSRESPWLEGEHVNWAMHDDELLDPRRWPSNS